MNTKTIIIVVVVFILSFSATFFIIKSNDHKECNALKIKVKNTNGILVESQKHICKEKYSF